ncbi:MAG: GDP-mannose 4,6-dehydratase [Chloroflexi bacterium]|nr:GDP-mannose 4,6-dehydratase [Chloroflexota bacterium]
MNILVTGGAGYIGSHLVDRLLSVGHQVTVVDDLSVGKMANLQRHLSDKRFRFIEGSILYPTMMDELMKDCQLVYHLAAVVGVKYYVEDPLKVIATNVRGTEVVLELAALHNCRVVLASTSEIYGKSSQIPFSEDGLRVLGPTWVHRWSYATSKALDEHLAFAYARRGLQVTVIRYFNSYGPRLDPRGYGSVVAKFIIQALQNQPFTVHGDGQQTRCFTYIEDSVEGTLLAGGEEKAIGEVFNIGNSQETSIQELAELVKELTGSESSTLHLPYQEVYGPGFEDPPRRVPDTSKANILLGFQAKVPLREGLEKTIAWFRSRQ